MATFTIKSRLAVGYVLFIVPGDGGYVIVSCRPLGWHLRQPCEGGGFTGSTLMSSPANLERDARRWWRAYLRNQRS